VHNELQCISTYPGSCSFVNADHTVHQGIEAGGGIEFLKSVFTRGDGLFFNATYTLNDFHFDNDPVYGNNRQAGVPTHLIRAELLYKRLNGFYAGPNIEWMPKSYYADNANTTTVDPYCLLNFRLGFEHFADRWSVYVEDRNLFDKRYISMWTSPARPPRPRRSFIRARGDRFASACSTTCNVEGRATRPLPALSQQTTIAGSIQARSWEHAARSAGRGRNSSGCTSGNDRVSDVPHRLHALHPSPQSPDV